MLHFTTFIMFLYTSNDHKKLVMVSESTLASKFVWAVDRSKRVKAEVRYGHGFKKNGTYLKKSHTSVWISGMVQYCLYNLV